MILAIDTATDQASVALATAEEVRFERSWRTAGNHSQQLAEVLRDAFAQVSGPDALDGVAVASGPGSFNGLRVGIATAKGIALARSIPLVGISSLDIIAYQHSYAEVSVWSVLNAGRGELYLAVYDGNGVGWRRVSEYRRVPVAVAATEYDGQSLLAGEGARVLAEQLRGEGRPASVASSATNLRRAGYLAELGRRYFDASGSNQVDELEPLYLRQSSAEEKRARMSGE